MPYKVRSFVATLFLEHQGPQSDSAAELRRRESDAGWLSWKQGPLDIAFRPRDVASVSTPPGADDVLLLGDDTEWDADRADMSLVSAVPIRWDAASRTLIAQTSIVGLPPLFMYRDRRCIVLASDVYLLAALSHVRLELDPAAVEDLGRIGHPVSHRTLFKNTELLPGGARVSVNAGIEGSVSVEPVWRLRDTKPLEWADFVEAQVAAFRQAVRRMDVSRSFLSLTAGLDTRTVFAALAEDQRLIPAVTMSGVHPSLDARTAGRLCRAYGVRHDLVTFDERFTRELPAYVEQASRLSGGLESFEQAPEVYLYRSLREEFTARVSGNLGNQVGRGGTEGVGVRGASLDILSPSLRRTAVAESNGHWLLSKLEGGEASPLAFILQQEIPFSSVGNFLVGNHFAVQQSPYANCWLIDTLSLKPLTGGSVPSASMLRMRLRDLNHRFFGEPADRSFQRMLLQRIGGYAATCPINYGWRATGGVSAAGLALGAATLLGMVVQKTRLDEGLLGAPLTRSGIPALHNFRRSSGWLKAHLEEFTRDVLTGKTIRERGLFDAVHLERLVDEHFTGRGDHYQTVVFALDVALADRMFCTRG